MIIRLKMCRCQTLPSRDETAAADPDSEEEDEADGGLLDQRAETDLASLWNSTDTAGEEEEDGAEAEEADPLEWTTL